jgi:hypothetical protein
MSCNTCLVPADQLDLFVIFVFLSASMMLNCTTLAEHGSDWNALMYFMLLTAQSEFGLNGP